MKRIFTSLMQDKIHGWGEVCAVLRGSNGRPGKCRCGKQIPVLTEAPFFMDQPVRYDPRHREYLVKGLCLRCRYTAEAFVPADDMPSFSDWVLPKAIDIMNEYDCNCTHPGPFYASHFVKDDDGYTGWLVMCRKCKSYVLVPNGLRKGLDSHIVEEKFVIRERYTER